MSDNIDVNISEEIVQEVVEVRVDENAAQAAIDAAALAQNILEDIQGIAANISEINTIITDSGFTKVAEIFTAAANSIWNINGLEYTNPADVIINIPLAASGMQRWDRIVLDTNNLFVRVPGPEIEINAPVPTIPDDTLEYTLFLVTDSAVGDATPPLVGNQYVKKSFYSPYVFSGTGSDAIIPLHPDGYSEIRLTNSGLVSIAGYDLSLITGVPSAEVPQNGKPYIIRNLTGHSIIIKHQLPAANFPFWLNDAADLEFPNNTAIYCHYDISGFNEVFKGWSIGGKRYQTFLFQSAATIILTADQKNFHQARFNAGSSVFSTLGLTLGSGIPETAGVLDLSYLSDTGVPNITPNYISKVVSVTLSYSRNMAESGSNTNIKIRLISDTKYMTDVQKICECVITSSTLLGNAERKVIIPILAHLPLSPHSNLKWTVRSNNGVAQQFNILRLNVDIEEI